MRLQLAFCLLLASAAPALADRIDGDWCSAKGEHLTIAGPAIRTPAGADLIGDNRRHSSSYEEPAGGPQAGQRVDMQQLSEEEMLLQHSGGDASGETETWRRCQATS